MHLLKCNKCRKYTLKEKCPSCNTPTVNSRPPKYSPVDRYGKYRRMMKKQIDENAD